MKNIATAIVFLLSPSLFGIDGQILINQSSVMANGGFPYRITQPGSYKLSGNLVAPLNQVGILVSAANVILDLNGFNIQCSADNSNPTGQHFGCITEGDAGTHHVEISNGTITANGSGDRLIGSIGIQGVEFSRSNRISVERLQIEIILNPNYQGVALYLGNYSRVKQITVLGFGGFATCPSLLQENIFPFSLALFGDINTCVLVNNIGVRAF